MIEDIKKHFSLEIFDANLSINGKNIVLQYLEQKTIDNKFLDGFGQSYILNQLNKNNLFDICDYLKNKSEYQFKKFIYRYFQNIYILEYLNIDEQKLLQKEEFHNFQNKWFLEYIKLNEDNIIKVWNNEYFLFSRIQNQLMIDLTNHDIDLNYLNQNLTDNIKNYILYELLESLINSNIDLFDYKEQIFNKKSSFFKNIITKYSYEDIAKKYFNLFNNLDKKEIKELNKNYKLSFFDKIKLEIIDLFAGADFNSLFLTTTITVGSSLILSVAMLKNMINMNILNIILVLLFALSPLILKKLSSIFKINPILLKKYCLIFFNNTVNQLNKKNIEKQQRLEKLNFSIEEPTQIKKEFVIPNIDIIDLLLKKIKEAKLSLAEIELNKIIHFIHQYPNIKKEKDFNEKLNILHEIYKLNLIDNSSDLILKELLNNLFLDLNNIFKNLKEKEEAQIKILTIKSTL